MQVTIRRMGNSQGVLIPKPLLRQLGLEGQAEMMVEGDALVLRPARPQAVSYTHLDVYKRQRMQWRD